MPLLQFRHPKLWLRILAINQSINRLKNYLVNFFNPLKTCVQEINKVKYRTLT